MKYLKKYSTEAERQAATAIEPSASIVVEDEGVYYDRAWDTPTEPIYENKSPYWTHDWKFIRPAEWPNLDEFDIAHATNTIVMTYDCRDRIAHPNDNNDHFHVKCSNSGSVIERYKVVNGEFVLAWTTTTTASNEVVSHLLPTNEGNYVVYKLYTNSTWYRYFFWSSDANRGEDGYVSTSNKILEIQGNCPGFQSAFYCWGSYPLRRLLWYNYSSKPMYWYNYCYGQNSIEHIEFPSTCYVSGSASRYFWRSRIKDFDFDNVVFSQASMNGENMFSYNPNLEEVHFGNNLPTISNIASIFQGCTSLKTADVSNLTLANTIADFSAIFRTCYSLESIDISTWTFPAATNFSYMFDSCHRVKDIIFGSYNFENVTTVTYMFANCFSLCHCHLSGKTVDLSKCTIISYIFYACTNLQEIDMSGWDLSGMTNGQNAQNMFYACSSLKKIILPSSLSVIHGNSFAGCNNLKTLIMNVATPPTATQIQNHFSSWNPNYKIYVPDASVDTYKTATGWLNAANHIYGISTYTGD